MREVRPWRRAFRLEVFFPISERGPVDSWALRRLASIWMTFSGEDNGFLLAGLEHMDSGEMAVEAGMLLKTGLKCFCNHGHRSRRGWTSLDADVLAWLKAHASIVWRFRFILTLPGRRIWRRRDATRAPSSSRSGGAAVSRPPKAILTESEKSQGFGD